MRIIRAIAALACVFALFAGVRAFSAQRVRPLAHVDVYRVTLIHNKPVLFTYPARLKSYRSVMIVARVAGVVLKRYFKEGSRVKRGELLFSIDPSIYEARVEEAGAKLQEAQAALFKAGRDLKRYTELYKRSAASREKMDNVISSYRRAVATVAVARAALRMAEIDLGYTKVRATIDGVVGERLVDVGDYVVPSTEMVKIRQIDRIYAEFGFPDSDLDLMSRMEAGSKWIRISPCRAFIVKNGKVFKGYVAYMDSAVDLQTSQLKAKALFKNVNNALLPGEFVRIRVSCDIQKDLLFVPSEAVIQTEHGEMVFVVEHGRIAIRMIKARETEGGFVVLGGLKPGELVVVDNFFRIRPGAEVKVDKVINK